MGEERAGWAGAGRGPESEISASERGVRGSRHRPPRILAPTHLQAGHPDAHGPHEQQVVSQELLQLADAPSLEGR